MAREYATQHWFPRALVARCGKRSLSAFMEDYADTYFLLIRLWDRHDNFSAGLMSREQELLEEVPDTGFTTADHSATVARLRAGGLLQPPEQAGAAPESQNDLCFLLPVRPRMQRGDNPRITLGRSRGREILFQHRSVSQLHAWLEFDAQGRLYLTDADSKNKTYLNAERVLGEPVLVAAGASLRFGAVRATVCEPATIWGVLSEEAVPYSQQG